MNLVMQIDELSKELSPKPYTPHIPVQTRLNFLKKINSVQESNIQFDCDHPGFKNGECSVCGLECEHWEYEEGHCVDCGSEREGYDPRMEPEWWGDR